MEKINFLPNSVKEKKYRKKESVVIIISILLSILIAVTIIHIEHTRKTLVTVKENVKTLNKPKVVKIEDKANEKVIKFYEDNLGYLADYDAINIYKNKISIKYTILNDDEFTEKIMIFEHMKNAVIDYIVAPYSQADKYMFEIGLDVTL